MEEVELFATSTDPLLLCLMCKRLLHEAVQLKCLHNCCRQCFNVAASTVGNEGVSCAACGAITESGCEQPNEFIDGQVQRYRAIAASTVCGVCKNNGDHDKPALLWCPACRHSLCGDCVAGHRQYFRQHVTKSLEELSSLDEVSIQPSTSACAVHKRVLEIGCRNCEKVKCFTCSADCVDKKHEIYYAGNESFDMYVGTLISSIASIEGELLRKSEVLQKPKSLLQATKEARDRHLEEIGMRKRRVVDAVATLYHEIETATKNAYDELEAERDAAAAVAVLIEANLSDARSYIRRLVESDDKFAIINQQKIVHERLSFLLDELQSLSKRLSSTMGEVKVESSLPDSVEDIIRAWIGIPGTYAASPSHAPSPSQLNEQQSQQQQKASPSPDPAPSMLQPPQQLQQLASPSHAPPPSQLNKQQSKQPHQASSSPPSQQQQQQQSFSFGAASDSFTLPVDCSDVALTQDGRSLLLAARNHGLIELSSASGRELSRWRPNKYSDHAYDVQAVAALSDRRAAVSIPRLVQYVVLLRRNETSSSSNSSSNTGRAAAAVAAAFRKRSAAGNDAWTVESCIDIPWCAGFMSAHGDLAAVYEYSGQRLHLLSLNSGLRLSDRQLQRDYTIGSLAVTASLLVTGSRKLGRDCRAAQVLDAHSLDACGGSDKRLWRHVLQEEEDELWSVCADSSGGCLYAAVRRSHMSSGRVSALSLADGSELRRVALSYHSAAAAAAASQPLLLPVRLSLCDDGAAEQQRSSSSSCSSRRSDGRALLLSVLCWNPATDDVRTVMLHRSTSDMLP